jgi:chromosome partitioning protein
VTKKNVLETFEIMLIITCEQCKTRYKFPVTETTPSTFKVKCSKCGNIFIAHKPNDENRPLELKAEAIVTAENKIIAVCNQKGGVAKTSTVANLGAALALLGNRVLLVDFDMQASLSITFGFTNKAKSFYDLVHLPDNGFADVIVKTQYKNLWILPSNQNLALLAKKNINTRDFEHVLRQKLELIRENIDYIIIDTPPSIEFFTLNAIMAADLVIIPTLCEYLSMHGIAHIEEAVHTINTIRDKEITHRILLTMFTAESTAARVIHQKIKDKYQDTVLDTLIPCDPKMQESQIMNKPVLYYDKQCPAARQYLELSRELTDNEI